MSTFAEWPLSFCILWATCKWEGTIGWLSQAWRLLLWVYPSVLGPYPLVVKVYGDTIYCRGFGKLCRNDKYIRPFLATEISIVQYSEWLHVSCCLHFAQRYCSYFFHLHIIWKRQLQGCARQNFNGCGAVLGTKIKHHSNPDVYVSFQ